MRAPNPLAPAPPLPQRTDAMQATAADVLRGLARHFYQHRAGLIAEYALPNGRRADAMVLLADGQLAIVEIKVGRADLLGDRKWPDYLAHCDLFYWAVPPGFDVALFDDAALMPERAGLIVADRYEASVLRAPICTPLSPPRRRAELGRIARAGLTRLMIAADPDLPGVHAAG